MDKKRIAAARLLLGRGLRFTIKDAPFTWRLLRLNRIVIRHLRAGTIAEIAMIIDRHGLNNIRTPADANANMEAIARVIAVAVLNHKRRIQWFARRLSRLLLWKMPATTLIDIYQAVESLNKLSDFTTITGYFSHQATMMMSPKTPGQMTKGS